MPRDIKASDSVTAIRDSVSAFLDKTPLKTGIIVAVSGGVDSIVLLDVVNSLSVDRKLKIAVAHVNHNIRPSAKGDQRFVRSLAARYGCEYFTVSKQVRGFATENKISIEMAGRTIRYQFFASLLTKTKYDAVATAHTQTDNAETVIMNLARGGGIKSLRAIAPRRNEGGTLIIRPMLDVDRPTILRYAKTKRLSWREDSTNTDLEIQRNYVRKKILPALETLNPRYAEAISRTSVRVREILEHLEPEIASIKRVLSREIAINHGVSIAIQPLKGYFSCLCSIALHELLRESFPSVLFESDDVERVIELAHRSTGSRAQLKGGLFALRERTHINVGRATDEVLPTMEIRLDRAVELGHRIFSVRNIPGARRPRASKNREYIDAATVNGSLILRPWKAGDVFVPLGMSGRKKVSDFLTDIKIPHMERNSVMVLESNGAIVWVCGQRIDHRVRVQTTTKRVLELSMKENRKPA